MKSLLSIVGLGKSSHKFVLSEKTAAKKAGVRFHDGELPDLSAVAAATEQAVHALEDEACGLEVASLQEAHSVLKGWSQGLRTQACRENEALAASFRVRFLRSNALERGLQALRRNVTFRKELAADGSITLELLEVLHLCLPRGAVPLALAVVYAVPAGGATEDCANATLETLRVLREDWTVAAWSLAIRGLERRLNSLADELPRTVEEVAHDNVAILAVLCQALEHLRLAAEVRSTEASASLRSLGAFLTDYARGVYGGADTAFGEELSDQLPSRVECEAAIAAMVSKKTDCMRQGLRILGLPESPLVFTPGRELRLCGRDVREDVNTMMAHWVEENMDEFYSALRALRSAVRTRSEEGNEQDAAPPTAASAVLHVSVNALAHNSRAANSKTDMVDALRAERVNAVHERDSLLQKLHVLDTRIKGLDSQLAAEVSAEASVAARPACSAILDALECVMSAVAAEARCEEEQSAEQIQHRRLQLLMSLAAYIEMERKRVVELSTGIHPGTTSNSDMDILLDAALRRLEALCVHVEAAFGGSGKYRVRLLPEKLLSVGAYCRARWIDGALYDAEVRCVPGDGAVVVDWLRPRPDAMAGSDQLGCRPLVTVSGCGGDDTIHRTVEQKDVYLNDIHDSEAADVRAAVSALLEARSLEDLICADCGMEGTDWASISFGVYLCHVCAGEHQRLGVCLSVVKRLDDGWGWSWQEFEHLRLGGNDAFRGCLAGYPVVQAAPYMERYTSRFAEYYRHRLESLCMGIVPPSLLPAAAAAEPATGEFISGLEAAAAVREAISRFEATTSQARSQLPMRIQAA